MAVAHRTGVVHVGEASVFIAVSSAHRREALEASASSFLCPAPRFQPGGGSAPASAPAASPRRLLRLLCQACHWAIDELKATAPIWKKEYFEGGQVWKENEEARRLFEQHRQQEGRQEPAEGAHRQQAEQQEQQQEQRAGVATSKAAKTGQLEEQKQEQAGRGKQGSIPQPTRPS